MTEEPHINATYISTLILRFVKLLRDFFPRFNAPILAWSALGLPVKPVI